MNETLSPPRLWFLLRGDFITGYRSLINVSATLAVVTLLTAMIVPSDLVFDNAFHRGPGFHFAVFGIALFAWGIIASSRVFRPLHHKTGNEAWLLLPASSLEKTLARLLAVTVGIVVYLLVFITLLSIVVESLNLLLFGNRNEFFNPLDPAVWNRISLYIVLQSLYFLGAAWFRRAHFIKTTLAIALTLAGLAAVGVLTARIVFADFPLDVSLHVRNLSFILETESESLYGMARAALRALMVLVPIACWGIAWLRVAEAQVSDGV